MDFSRTSQLAYERIFAIEKNRRRYFVHKKSQNRTKRNKKEKEKIVHHSNHPTMCTTSYCVTRSEDGLNRSTGSETQFPGKLHDMLLHVERNGLDHIVSWVQNGRAFMVHNVDKLVEILPLFCGQTKYRSFQRQLNMWHFERILDGCHKGAWTHPYFVRGQKILCSKMSRHVKLPLSQYIRLRRDISVWEAVHASQNSVSFSSSSNEEHCPPTTFSSSTKKLLEQKPVSGDELHEKIFTDGDLVSFAGRQFYFLDIKRVSRNLSTSSYD